MLKTLDVNTKQNTIDINTLGKALYSLNKYAKSIRDKEYKSKKDINKRNYLYSLKEEALSYFKPQELHFRKPNEQITKVFDYEVGYKRIDKYIKKRSYYDVKRMRPVEYKVVKLKGDETHEEYFLLYILNNFLFHVPIDRQKVYKYKNLKRLELKSNWKTSGDLSKLSVYPEKKAINIVLDFLNQVKTI